MQISFVKTKLLEARKQKLDGKAKNATWKCNKQTSSNAVEYDSFSNAATEQHAHMLKQLQSNQQIYHSSQILQL